MAEHCTTMMKHHNSMTNFSVLFAIAKKMSENARFLYNFSIVVVLCPHTKYKLGNISNLSLPTEPVSVICGN